MSASPAAVRRTHHVHGVAVEELLCCDPHKAVHQPLFVEQESLQLMVEGATVRYTFLV